MKGFRLLLIVFISGVQVILSQADSIKNIDNKLILNQEKFQEDPIQAYDEIDKLIAKAIQSKDADAELRLLAKRYEYDYLLKIDFEQMISSANILKDRAIAHKNLLYEAISHKYLSQVYTFNELYEKALEELQLSLEVINRISPETPKVIMERANIYTAFANIYTLKKEYFSGIQALLNSVEEHKKLTNQEQKRGTQFMDYANLGGAYLRVNLDSASYYANKSISYSTNQEADHNLMFINYLVLGNVHLAKEEYDQALIFYKKAEAIEENKYFLNIKELYENFSEIYRKTGNRELLKKYENKLKDLSLTVAKNQNSSLRKIIQNDRQVNNTATKPKETGRSWLWIGSLLFVAIAIVIFIYKRYKTSEKNNLLTPEKYNELLNLLKDNDQTFLLAFEREYPDFSQKLLKITSDLSHSEIELLAMVKLGLSNKKIAQYKFVQHKTVQNKRHIIRKKLDLSSDTDLNKWIEDFG